MCLGLRLLHRSAATEQRGLAAIFAAAAVLVLSAVACAADAAADDERFLEGLRERRLFELAETYCRRRLESGRLEPREEAKLAIELIRTSAAHAVYSPPDEREARWQTAHEAAADFLRRHPDHPRSLLIRVQDALTHLARGELARQEAEIGAGGEDVLVVARGEIRAAAAQLEEIDDELERAIPRSEVSPRIATLSRAEMTSLAHHVRQQRARAYSNRALVYPPGSDDRIAALTRALGQLDDLVTRLPEGDPLLFDVQLDRAVCLRRLASFERSQLLLVELEGADWLSRDERLLVRAERIRLLLAQEKSAELLAALRAGRTIDGRGSAELDLAHLEAYLFFWRQAAKDQQADAVKQWQDASLALVKQMEAAHGAYWGRRADLLLVTAAGAGGAGQELEILIRTADNLYLKKEYGQAIVQYDRAAELARNAQDDGLAFSLAYKAALIEHLRGERGEAARRLRGAALAHIDQPGAAKAHLLAAWNAAQLAAENESARDEYLAMLEEHLDAWPESPTTDKARFWLGRMREHEGAWPEAVAAYVRITPAAEHYAEAVEAAARCAESQLAALQAKGEPIDAPAAAAAGYFEKLLSGKSGRPPAEFDAVDRTAALTAARIRLKYSGGGHADAAGILGPALQRSPGATEAWRREAESLYVVALAAQPDRRQEALALVTGLADAEPQQLLEMLDGLSKIAATARDEARAGIAELQLQAVELLKESEAPLPESDRRRLSAIEAEALAAAGRTGDAKTVFAKLAAEHPQDGPIQESYGRFLLDSGDAALRRAALDQWRRIAAASPLRSERWWRAKYSIARAHSLLDEKSRAADLINYLRVTPPGLDAAPNREEFLALLAECEK